MRPALLRTLCLIASVGGKAHTPTPPHPLTRDYSVPELRLRADSGPAFNVPSQSYFGQEDPLFFDNQDFILKFLVFRGEARAGVLRWSQETGLSYILVPENSFPSGLSVDPRDGSIFFEQLNYGYFSEGVMRLSRDFKSIDRVFWDPSYAFTSSPHPLPHGGLMVRENTFDGAQALSRIVEGRPREFIAAASRDPASPYSFLFAPVFNSAGFMAVKLRHGLRDSWAESQPDEVALIDFRGPQPARLRAFSDHDLDPHSVFAGFDNTGALNANGDLAWVARLKNGRRAIIKRSVRGSISLLAEEGKAGIASFSYFRPAIDSRGRIIFRATSSEGFEGIWIVDDSQTPPRILVQQGDVLKTDRGPARAGVKGDTPQVFFASPQVNAHGDILMGIFLTAETEDRKDIGLGFFVFPRIHSAP